MTLAYQLVHFHDIERGDGRTQIAVHFRAAKREHMPDDGAQAVARDAVAAYRQHDDVPPARYERGQHPLGHRGVGRRSKG